ncbi:MAG: indole-3-glycerol-phosphate synthase TrpC, partial [Chloroflexi bacterium]|nr:indole-3-glycerol-phosphate synthase TrpC [Chloroflexota bacterium]
MILDDIIANKRAEIAARKKHIPLAEFRTRAESAPTARDFVRTLRGGDTLALIAEIKRASPSRGVLRAAGDPARL